MGYQNTSGVSKAKQSLDKIIKEMACSKLRQVKSLGNGATLIWEPEDKTLIAVRQSVMVDTPERKRLEQYIRKSGLSHGCYQLYQKMVKGAVWVGVMWTISEGKIEKEEQLSLI